MKKWNLILLLLLLFLSGCSATDVPLSNNRTENTEIINQPSTESETKSSGYLVSESTIPEYSGASYVEVNENIPFFEESEKNTEVFENYSPLDSLGRCGVAYANACAELMPTEKRGEIGQIKPTGWHTVKYDCIEDLYCYNRCHLIAFCICGENANERNLITGTRYMNLEMLPFETKIADYIKESNNHVLYRVTPVFIDTELVARGVLMEAYSVEDNGEGIQFNIFCYNVQPGIIIDYQTGETWEAPDGKNNEAIAPTEEQETRIYVLNTNTRKIHLPDCDSVSNMAEANKEDYNGNLADLLNDGYVPCRKCMDQE